MNDCIFCKIINGEIETELKYEDEYVIAFSDIHPQAKIHLLIVPKRHIESILDLSDDDCNIFASILQATKTLVKENQLENGFRLLTNTGKDAGQTIKHLHFHLLGGNELGPIT